MKTPSEFYISPKILNEIPIDTVKEMLLKFHHPKMQETVMDAEILKLIKKHTGVFKQVVLLCDHYEPTYRIMYVVNYCGHLVLYNEALEYCEYVTDLTKSKSTSLLMTMQNPKKTHFNWEKHEIYYSQDIDIEPYLIE